MKKKTKSKRKKPLVSYGEKYEYDGASYWLYRRKINRPIGLTKVRFGVVSIKLMATMKLEPPHERPTKMKRYDLPRLVVPLFKLVFPLLA